MAGVGVAPADAALGDGTSGQLTGHHGIGIRIDRAMVSSFITSYAHWLPETS